MLGDRSIVRKVTSKKSHKTEGSQVRRVRIPKITCKFCEIIRRITSLTSHSPKCHKSEGSQIRKFDVNFARLFEGSQVRRVKSPKSYNSDQTTAIGYQQRSEAQWVRGFLFLRPACENYSCQDWNQCRLCCLHLR